MSKHKNKRNIKLTTIIGKNTEFRGNFVVDGSARVDGVVHGNLEVSGCVIVGACGYVSGNIEADTAIVGGEVIGNVTAHTRLEMTGTAKVYGDIKTQIIVIDASAVFHGQCDMDQEEPQSGEQRTITPKLSRVGKKSAKQALQEALREVEEDENREASEDVASPNNATY
jgi:cytoskeletal protein CcmA (bactofilin family)